MLSTRHVFRISLSVAFLSIAMVWCAAVHGEEAKKDAKDASQQRNLDALQHVYQEQVPHTDGRGVVLSKYDPQKSFFPIAMWGVLTPGEYYGRHVDWKPLQAAGVNTVWPWPGDIKKQLQFGAEYGMKIVVMSQPAPELLKEVKDDPALFGNVWMDEPIGKLGSLDMDKLFGDFLAYREAVHKVAPTLPVFINDSPWINEPATSWWIKWNTTGDISCHDNYPIMNNKARVASIGLLPHGIPQSVALAAEANHAQKPVWLIVGAFDQPGKYGQPCPFRYPTPEQLRGCVYAGIIHGATGIVYFIWDSHASRDGSVIGMSPDPLPAYVPVPRQANYPHPTPASPVQMIKAKALWETMTQINKELVELTPCILSPTVGDDFKYTVDIVGTSPTPTPLRCMLKPHPEGGYVLLTTNLDDAVLQVTYTLPTAVPGAELMFENQEPLQLTAEGKSFTITYEPFDTHVVRIKQAK